MPRLQHKRGRKSNYRRTLNTEYWREVCRLVRVRDGHRCRRCGKNYGLEIHHTTYYVNGQSIVGHELEHMDRLITLCEDCHQQEHSNGTKH